MKKAGLVFIPIFILGLMAGTSYPFGLGDVFKEIDKTTRGVEQLTKPPEPVPPKVPTPDVPATPRISGAPTPPRPPTSAEPVKQVEETKKKGGGGLIGLGTSLGVIDKKTSKVLSTTTQTFKALQPIGYQEEKAIGEALAVEVFDKFGGQYKDDALQKYVNLVGQALVQVSDRADIPYYFSIVNTSDPNAFATPGGYVFVSRGLLQMLQSEAQLAGVLGHEIAHITQKHALKTIERSKSLQGIGTLSMTLLDEDPGKFNQLISEVSNTLFTKGLDKNLEHDADRLGMEYAYRLGYNPKGLIDFIRILGGTKSHRSIFFSTHPSPRARYSALKNKLGNYRAGAKYPHLASRYKTRTQGKL